MIMAWIGHRFVNLHQELLLPVDALLQMTPSKNEGRR